MLSDILEIGNFLIVWINLKFNIPGIISFAGSDTRCLIFKIIFQNDLCNFISTSVLLSWNYKSLRKTTCNNVYEYEWKNMDFHERDANVLMSQEKDVDVLVSLKGKKIYWCL